LHPFGARLHKLEAAIERSGVLLRERIEASTRGATQQLARQIERNSWLQMHRILPLAEADWRHQDLNWMCVADRKSGLKDRPATMQKAGE